MDPEHEYMVVFIRFFGIVFVILAFMFFSRIAFGENFDCVTTHIVDGDTLEVFCPVRDSKEIEVIRIVGVQAPEEGETGYEQATKDLRRLARGFVQVIRFGKDRYGRTLGIVESEKGCVNVLMRKRWKDTRYDGLLTKKQKQALERRGWK